MGGFGASLKFGGGFLGGGGKSSDTPLEFVPLLKTHKGITDKMSSVTIATGSANTEFQKQFDTEQLPAPPVYAARLSSLLKTLDSADAAIKGAIEARRSHIRNIERLLEQSKAALARDEQTATELQAKRQKTEETKDSVEKLIMENMDSGDGEGEGDRSSGDKTPDESPEIEALTPPAQIQYEADMPVPASELHHRHSIAPASPPNSPPEFHAGASELLASLAGPLHNGGALKRPQADENMFEGIDDDLVNMFKNEQQQQQPKRTKFEAQDDEYVP